VSEALAPVLDLLEEELVRIDAKVDEAEGEGIRERWIFGRRLLDAQVGKQLPKGLLDRVAERTHKSRRELQYRLQFARMYASAEEVRNAIAQFRSWYAIVNKALPNPHASVVREVNVPVGIFSTIVADPPWRYTNRATRGAAENHYTTMSVDELCDPAWIEKYVRAADDCHLYLWTTHAFLRDAFDVLEAWSFEYRTHLAWVKPQIGMGNYFRSAHEHVLFATRGELPILDRTLISWFEARRSKHSKKPGCFYDLVEKASPGPYLEMFARSRRLGWEAWGNEA
jgi:N6-adenosine-specific RNA methylase IME4